MPRLNRRLYSLAVREALEHASDDVLGCGTGGGSDEYFPLRIAAIFIIMAGSMSGALFPVLSRRTRWLSTRVPKGVFDFAKYFGSGVIIATAFIHLLDPAIEELGSPCIDPSWQNYPYALAIAMCSIFFVFLIEIVAFRWGSAKLASLSSFSPTSSLTTSPHDQGSFDHLHNTEAVQKRPSISGPSLTLASSHVDEKDLESGNAHEDSVSPVHDGHAGHSHDHHNAHGRGHSHSHGDDHGQGEGHGHVGALVDSAITQIIGIGILEFGVLLHSLLIGLTLAVTEEFKVLLIVIVFHQTFEGLGVGSRLAYMDLPHSYNYIPILGAFLYGITTPIGIAVGLGVRSTYNPESAAASVVSGVLDAFSAGILIYTGLVELLAHEFLFSKDMMSASNSKLAYAIGSMMLGCALMALLGRWV